MSKSTLDKGSKLEIQMLLEAGKTIAYIADALNVSVSSVSRYLKTLGPDRLAELRGDPGPSPEQARIAVLEEENRRLRAWVKRYGKRIEELEGERS